MVGVLSGIFWFSVLWLGLVLIVIIWLLCRLVKVVFRVVVIVVLLIFFFNDNIVIW